VSGGKLLEGKTMGMMVGWLLVEVDEIEVVEVVEVDVGVIVGMELLVVLLVVVVMESVEVVAVSVGVMEITGVFVLVENKGAVASGPNEVVDSTEGSKVGSGVVDDDDSSGSGKEAVGLNRGIKAIYPSGLAILA